MPKLQQEELFILTTNAKVKRDNPVLQGHPSSDQEVTPAGAGHFMFLASRPEMQGHSLLSWGCITADI